MPLKFLAKFWSKLQRFVSSLFKLVRLGTFPRTLDLLRYLEIRHLSRFQAPKRATLLVKLKTGGTVYVTIRGNTTDANVLWETFVEGHFHYPVEGIPRNAVVLDLGSNIGLTCLDFATSLGADRVVGVEMASENFEVARRNCEQISKISLLEGAVWSSGGQVGYEKADGEWGYKVSTETEGASARSFTVTEVLDRFQLKHVDFAKIDIEGAEAEIFNEDRADLSWLGRVEQVQIELHAPVTYEQIASVLTKQGFNCVQRATNEIYVLAKRIHSSTTER